MTLGMDTTSLALSMYRVDVEPSPRHLQGVIHSHAEAATEAFQLSSYSSSIHGPISQVITHSGIVVHSSLSTISRVASQHCQTTGIAYTLSSKKTQPEVKTGTESGRTVKAFVPVGGQHGEENRTTDGALLCWGCDREVAVGACPARTFLHFLQNH